MGEIVGAGLLAHVPTVMFSKEGRMELNEGKEISLVPGFHRLREEVLDVLKPDVVVLLDSHWFTLWEFVVTAHARREGKLTSEELPRGAPATPYDLKGDPEFARLVAEKVRGNGTRCIANDDPHLPLKYPTVYTAHYLERGEAWLSIGLSQTARDHNYLAVGKGLAEAIEASDRRVVIIASGALSHRFWPMDELPDHEASDPIHIRTPEARAADEERLTWFRDGQHARVIDSMDEFRPHMPEGNFGHYLIMVGALGGRDCKAVGRQFSDYENSIGTGQVHVWFDKPEGGWH